MWHHKGYLGEDAGSSAFGQCLGVEAAEAAEAPAAALSAACARQAPEFRDLEGPFQQKGPLASGFWGSCVWLYVCVCVFLYSPLAGRCSCTRSLCPSSAATLSETITMSHFCV